MVDGIGRMVDNFPKVQKFKFKLDDRSTGYIICRQFLEVVDIMSYHVDSFLSRLKD